MHTATLSNSFTRTLAALLLSAAVAACAVVQTPAPIVAFDQAADAQNHVLGAQLLIEPDTGYTRTIKAGSQWRRIGKIAQGDVFRPYQDVFTLEGAHIHEAYLVVDQGILVGFYLPAERSFSGLKQKKTISLQPRTL